MARARLGRQGASTYTCCAAVVERSGCCCGAVFIFDDTFFGLRIGWSLCAYILHFFLLSSTFLVIIAISQYAYFHRCFELVGAGECAAAEESGWEDAGRGKGATGDGSAAGCASAAGYLAGPRWIDDFG